MASASISVAVARTPMAARLIIRDGDRAAAVIGQAFGVMLPRDACRANIAGERAALWLGPDEWLLVATDSEPEHLLRDLTEALGQEPASIVDVSHRQIGISVAGSGAVDALNSFNALDLAESAFPVGMCTRTVFGKVEIVLWRTAREAFRIEVWRSFAPYVLACLEEAITDPAIAM